jgi:DNA (cytosine-5)-methyltransferase 1
MEHREVKTPEQIADLKKRSPGGYRNLRESVINELPVFGTPTTATSGRSPEFRKGSNPNPVEFVEDLLMTPVASEGFKAPAQQTSETKSKTGQVWLSNQAKDMETNWGKFAPAIERWESLTRVAPAPTKPDGKDGNHRLSADFTEWMMGLPEGWVTAEDIGLKRNDQLKACGNGVVPQQAELALRILLQDVKI